MPKQVVNFRASERDYEEWRQAASPEPLSAWIRRVLNRELREAPERPTECPRCGYREHP